MAAVARSRRSDAAHARRLAAVDEPGRQLVVDRRRPGARDTSRHRRSGRRSPAGSARPRRPGRRAAAARSQSGSTTPSSTMARMWVGYRCRVGEADGRAVGVPGVGELGLAEGASQLLEVADRRRGVDVVEQRTGVGPALFRDRSGRPVERASGVLASGGSGSSASQGRARSLRRPAARLAPVPRVSHETMSKRRSSWLATPKPRSHEPDPRRAGSARVDDERADAMGPVRGGSADDRQLDLSPRSDGRSRAARPGVRTRAASRRASR